MDSTNPPCDHRWTYFVDVNSRAVRLRRCERCGTREDVGEAATAATATAARLKQPA